VIKDDHMPAESETCRGSWLVYSTTFAVVLPVLYVLSSGPAQCIERTDAGTFTVGRLFVKGDLNPWVKDDLSIPFRQGSFALCRWAPPIRKIYTPLELLSERSATGKILGWYWNIFRPPSHFVEFGDLQQAEDELDPRIALVCDDDETERGQTEK
jgi:hypothetical protein